MARWPSRARPPAKCPTMRPPPRTSSSRSATAPPRSTPPPRKPRRMAKASPRPAGPSPRSRRNSNRAAPCCCARASARTAASSEKLPCSLKIEIETPRGLIAAPVYEISIEGILISGPDAEKLPQNQSLAATLQDVGACRIRIGEHSKAGTQAQFERPDAALREAIEDKLWAIQDENTEFVTRAMEAGVALTKIFEKRRSKRRDLDRGHVRHRLCRNPRQQSGAVPHQDPRLGRPRAAAVPGSLPRQGCRAWRSAR